MIQIEHVSKLFDSSQNYAVRDISLNITAGETLVLLGGSGSGKSTTLKMINGLIRPSEGTISFCGQDIRAYHLSTLRRQIGYVFQGIGLFPHLTASENITIVHKLMGEKKSTREALANQWLEKVGLEANVFAKRYPHELSGGQQQRVGVARAFSLNPKCLLMDEPFGALDAVTRDKLQSIILNLKEHFNKTILFVTHDIFEAFKLADRIAIMKKGEIMQVDTPAQLLIAPANQYVADLLDKAREQSKLFAEKQL